MGKIIAGAQVPMDGGMQAPGGPTEDPTKGFKFGGWVMPSRHQASGDRVERERASGRWDEDAGARLWRAPLTRPQGSPHPGHPCSASQTQPLQARTRVLAATGET